MKKKEKKEKVKQQEVEQEETELLEETKELENDTKLNNAMLKLEKEIETLHEEKKKLEEKVMLAQAEQINYRKRKDEETANTLKFANQGIITELLPIVDNFERALKKDDSQSEELKKFLSGFELMYNNLKEILTHYGVEEINRTGEVFNPQEEQALLTETREDLEDEVVIEVLQKGYKLKERVIRPASVKINQK